MTSIYLQCDYPGCKEVVDRRSTNDNVNQGTYRRADELWEYATQLGWEVNVNGVSFPNYPEIPGLDYCPKHKGDAKPVSD